MTTDPAGASPLEQLLVVQEHDTTSDRLRHRREHLPERDQLRAMEGELARIEAEVAELESRRDELTRSQQHLEDEIAAVTSKAAEVDRRLYSGTVTAPRELQAMQDELSGLRRRKSMLEDQDLEVMEAAEPVDADLAKLGAERERLAAETAVLRAGIVNTEAELDAQLTETSAARAAVAADLPADLLAHYEDLRRRMAGVVAARLVGRSCGGCHLELPATEIDRIRRQPADALIHCEECGRILVR